ncbi:MAG: hypothetical protein Q4C85_02970 [Actinomyces sp.]|uniref:hypothetical protein n=1 Tax=Actinomyces sp. TaxID=29317 RepID=UPI0026DDA262|nr:hypothetical protein [Actinomyces sp.]MDO4242716.1 hypothetical protein [Actinomyces sp.]
MSSTAPAPYPVADSAGFPVADPAPGRNPAPYPAADPAPTPAAAPSDEPARTPSATPGPAPTAEPETGICRPGELMWPGQQEGTTVYVTGGAYAVSTEELDDFAATLTSAAQWLDDAAIHAEDALAAVRAAEAPPDDEVSLGGPFSPDAGPEESFGTQSPITILAPWAHPGFYRPICRAAIYASMTPIVPYFVGPPSILSAFEMRRATAEDALESLLDGLDEAALSLRDLASQVTQASETYGTAENAAGASPEVEAALRYVRVMSLTMGWSNWGAVVMMAGAVSRTLGLGEVGSLDAGTAAALQNLQVILQDAELTTWVAGDLLLLAVLASWAAKADQGDVSPVMEQYLAETAARVDDAVSAQLPDQVQVGSRMVETSSLTPMQRVSYYLAMLSESNGQTQFGRRTGVTVTPRGGQGVTVPPGVDDPFGLGTAVAAVGGGVWAQGRTLRSGVGAQEGQACQTQCTSDPLGLDSISGLIEYADSVKAEGPDSGVVSILRTTHEDGTNSWVVVIPGTREWTLGDSNPQDQLTNLEAVSGRPTDMETAVVTAMRQAGIQPGEPVGLYGHSQGGATAVNIAADPAIAEQFTITSVLTAGAPTAGAVLPSSVEAVHIEDDRDVVPALDGARTPRTTSRTVVTIDSSNADIETHPHAQSVYAQTTDGMTGNPSIDQYNDGLAALTGAGEDNAQTTEMVFDITREVEPLPEDTS